MSLDKLLEALVSGPNTGVNNPDTLRGIETGFQGLQAASQVGSGIQALLASNRNAALLRTSGREAFGQLKQQGRLLAGEQTAAFGASGVGPAGTPTQVVLDSATQVDLQARRVFKAFENEALSQQITGRAMLLSSLFDANATVLGKAFEADNTFRRSGSGAGSGPDVVFTGTSRKTNPRQSGTIQRFIA